MGDNVDINIGSMYGNVPFHARAQIKIVLPASEVDLVEVQRSNINPNEKSSILKNIEIKLIQF